MNKIYFIQTMICVPRPFCEEMCTKLPLQAAASKPLFALEKLCLSSKSS